MLDVEEWSDVGIQPKFTGVWMSIILRPNLLPQKAPQLTLIAAVAIVQAIEELTDLHPQIKWPNDILINGKKDDRNLNRVTSRK